MRAFVLFLRSLHTLSVVLLGLFGYLGSRLARPRASASEVRALRGEALVRTLERLGATYVKLGQIASTRPDILPVEVTTALARLQDKVAPAPWSAIERVLRDELSDAQRAALGALDPVPVAAASVAQVHRAVAADGQVLAVKIQRPDIEGDVDRDLTLMALVARMLDALPSLHLLSIPGAVAAFAQAMRAQLDFRIEADNNRRFAANFADHARVRVPALRPELCTRRVLVMEFVDGVRATDPESVGGDRKALAAAGLEAILRMVFRDAFVHADMHPGNILLTAQGEVVLLDLGLVAEIPGEMRRPYVETFVALGQYDGEQAARLFYGHAPAVGRCDLRAFERDVVAHFETLRGKSLGELEASAVLSQTMGILRTHGVQIDPVFTVVNLAMVVAEGLGKQLDPDLDLLEVAMPHLLEAMMTAPDGRPFLRPVDA